MTKLEDRLSIVGMLFHQSYDDGVIKGRQDGYDEGYKLGYDAGRLAASVPKVSSVAESK